MLTVCDGVEVKKCNERDFTARHGTASKDIFKTFQKYITETLKNFQEDSIRQIPEDSLTYIIRYFENQRIIPVTVELDLKQQTEHVISYDPNEGWKSVSFYDFSKLAFFDIWASRIIRFRKKVAYKDSETNQCFVSNLEGENLDEDRKRLQQINGIVKGFYIPTLTIHKEITNTTEIHEEFGHLIHLFCNGSDVSYVTRDSKHNRKRRDTTGSNGNRGEFTHHSYGHYGHQSNNYAHYGHETHIKGVVDKDGNLRNQKISEHQTRSHGSQIYPPSGVGDMRQSQSTDSTSSSRGSQFPSSFQNNLARDLGGSGQFSLQTAQESGYQLNLPLGLRAGNTYRGGIHSQGQYGTGGTQPHVQTSYHRYPGTQIGDTSGSVDTSHQRRISQPPQQVSGDQVSSRYPQPGYPSIADTGRGVYGVTDQGQRIDTSGQPGLTTSYRPGTDGIQPGTLISRDGRPGGYVPTGTHPISPTLDVSGQRPGIISPGQTIPGYQNGHPSTIHQTSLIPSIPGSEYISTTRDRMPDGHIRQPGYFNGRTINGQRITPSGGIVTDSGTISQDQRPASPGYIPGYTPGSTFTRPNGIQVDQSGGFVPGIPGSYSVGPPGTIPTGPVGTHIDQTGRVTTGIPGSYPIGPPGTIPTGPTGILPDQTGRVTTGIPGSYPVLTPGSYPVGTPGSYPVGTPGSYPVGPPGSISTRPTGIQTDQFGRIIPDISGYPDRQIQSGLLPQDIRDSRVSTGQVSRPGYINGRTPGTVGGISPGSYDVSSRDGRGSLDGSQVAPGFVPGYTYPGDSRFTGDSRLTGVRSDGLSTSQIHPAGFIKFGGGDSASSQTQIQTGLEGTAAEASSAGQYRGLGSQTQVQGGYRGNGSFSAQAQSGFTGGVSQSQVQGGKQGGLSGSSAVVEQVGSAQSQVQIGQPSGSASSTAQGRFSSGMTQVQAQSSKSGGSAGAESQSTGLSNSQVQVNIGGEDGRQQNDFQGTVSASVHGGHSSGQSQTQLQGGYNSGRTYVATAQGGFDSTTGYHGTVPSSGSLPVLTSQTGTTSGQQTVHPSGTGLVSSDGTSGTFSRRPDQIYDSRQPTSTHPGSPGPHYQPGFDSRYPSISRPGITGSQFQPGHQITSPSQIPSGQIYPETHRPGHQPGSVQQPSQISTGYPSSQILPSQPGTQHRYPSGIIQPPSQISTGHPSSVQISPPHPGTHQSRYPPSVIQTPSGFPSPLQILPPHPGSQQPGIIHPSQVSTGIPSSSHQTRYPPGEVQTPSGYPSHLQILPPHPSVQQPGIIQPPSQISTGYPSHLQILPPHPSVQQPGIIQPPSQISTGYPSHLQILPPHPSGQQPGIIQPPSQISPGYPSHLQILPPHPRYPSHLQILTPHPSAQQPGIIQPPSQISTGYPSQVLISPPQPGTQQVRYPHGTVQHPSQISTGLPSPVQISPQQPGLQQPGLLRPPSHVSTGIPSSVPGGQLIPGSYQPSSLTPPSTQTRPPGVREPDMTDEGRCCEALRDLKRRCCDRSNDRNGKPDSCCSRPSKSNNDFDLDDDSEEGTNGEPCKVVKAICYIVYKPVGKARICKPTKTNGC
ncbi:uncharacterized protein CEXT_331341 [Caerostris extrusa]|uniref:Uncharacterized protein n=1 Tax=Caerostris extrusa TaxID=172846 RepID=A0AAV4NMP8_CAEEX|nr:uncharacterized protein CEXT_331341 [Caerostris extrusa]